MKMKAALRKKISKRVQNILSETYFSEIPLGSLFKALEEEGVVILQEDIPEWSSFLCGDDSQAVFALGDASSEQINGLGAFYQEFDNARLVLSWYKSDSRKDSNIEVIGYVS